MTLMQHHSAGTTATQEQTVTATTQHDQVLQFLLLWRQCLLVQKGSDTCRTTNTCGEAKL